MTLTCAHLDHSHLRQLDYLSGLEDVLIVPVAQPSLLAAAPREYLPLGGHTDRMQCTALYPANRKLDVVLPNL